MLHKYPGRKLAWVSDKSVFLQKQSRRHLQDETVLGAAELTPLHVSKTPEDKSKEMTFFPKYCHHLAYMYFNKTPLSKPPAKYRTVLIMILLRYLKYQQTASTGTRKPLGRAQSRSYSHGTDRQGHWVWSALHSGSDEHTKDFHY